MYHPCEEGGRRKLNGPPSARSNPSISILIRILTRADVVADAVVVATTVIVAAVAVVIVTIGS
jgi:hypothetical protein